MSRRCSFLVVLLSLLVPQDVSSFLVGGTARLVAKSPAALPRAVLVSARASALGLSTRTTTPQSLEDSALTQKLPKRSNSNPSLHVAFSTAILCSVLLLGSPASTPAYEDSDYASETVQAVVQSLKDSAGNSEQLFKSYENIGDIITEGKGVGGEINYKGVQLDRGYISDEDTSIYNPGLTLLTESEKERITGALVESRKTAVNQNQWSENNQSAFELLRSKLDPFHTYELGGYLGILPFYAAVVYLAVLAVQQNARSIFPIAYGVGVAAIFLPAVVLIVLGPQ